MLQVSDIVTVGLNVKYPSLFCDLFQNLTFQVEQKVKTKVVESIGTDQLFRLLSDSDANIVMKTLGLLRNLLTNKQVQYMVGNTYPAKYALACLLFFFFQSKKSRNSKLLNTC